MCEIWTMGEMLVEIMRPRAGMALFTPGEFIGPFPSGAPAIFIDTVARLNHSAGILLPDTATVDRFFSAS